MFIVIVTTYVAFYAVIPNLELGPVPYAMQHPVGYLYAVFAKGSMLQNSYQ